MIKYTWMQEQSFEAIYIKKNDAAKTPVATVAVPMGWQDNPKWKAEAQNKANLIEAAPIMLHALEVAQLLIDDKEISKIIDFAIGRANGTIIRKDVDL